jgi:hypothetical protein
VKIITAVIGETNALNSPAAQCYLYWAGGIIRRKFSVKMEINRLGRGWVKDAYQ